MHDAEQPDAEQPLLISDAGRILCLADRSVRLLEAAGVLRAARTPGGLRIFRRGDVERVAAERAKRRAVGGPVSVEPLPLAAAAVRLRGRAGRPRKQLTPEEREARAEAHRARKQALLAGVQPRLLDVDQAARYYGSVSPWTIRDLHAAGRLPAVRLPLGGDRELRRLLFDVRDLDALIEQAKDGAEAGR